MFSTSLMRSYACSWPENTTDGWQSGWMSCTTQRLAWSYGRLARSTQSCAPQLLGKEKGQHNLLPLKSLSPKPDLYFEYTKCPRRFCCQHCSLDSVQNGFSLP